MKLEMFGKMVNILKLMGVGTLETKIYLELIIKGSMTARELSESLKIPYSKIYSYIVRAQKMGLIDKSAERPAKYYAKHPDLVWNSFKRESMRELEKFEEEVMPILREAYEAKPKISSPASRVVILQGINQVRDKALQVLMGDSDEVLVAIPSIDFLSEELLYTLKSISMSKSLKVLVDLQTYKAISKLKSVNLEVKVKKEMFGGGVVSSQVLLLIKYGGTYIGLWSDYAFFTEVARVYFNYLWTTT